MPRLERIQSQDVAALLPPKQQAVVVRPIQEKVTPTPTTKNEKRKQSPVHHGTNISSTIQKKKPKTQKKKKDPNEPKQIRSAYNFYTKDARPKIVARGMSSNSNVNTQLGAQWKALSAEEKLPYERMAMEDRGRYTKEKAAYDFKTNSSDETNKQAEGTTTEPVSVSNPVKMGGRKCNAMVYATGDNDEKNNTADIKKRYDAVISTEVVKREDNFPNDIPSASQKSLESVDVDLLVEPQEKKGLLTMTTKLKNNAPGNSGNKENNSAAGKKGLSKSLAAAKSGVTRFFNNRSKRQEQKTVVRAGSYIAVVRKREGSNDRLGNAKVDEPDNGEGVNGRYYAGEKEAKQKREVRS